MAILFSEINNYGTKLYQHLLVLMLFTCCAVCSLLCVCTFQVFWLPQQNHFSRGVEHWEVKTGGARVKPKSSVPYVPWAQWAVCYLSPFFFSLSSPFLSRRTKQSNATIYSVVKLKFEENLIDPCHTKCLVISCFTYNSSLHDLFLSFLTSLVDNPSWSSGGTVKINFSSCQ